MASNFLNKKIFITGAFGFLGNRLKEELSERGAIIYALAGPDDQYESADAGRIKKVFKENIRNRDAIAEIIEEVRPEIIYHLASIVSVPYSKEHPLETMDINFGGTMNLLEAARSTGGGKFIYASSVEIYEGSDCPIDENFLISPNSPYAASKVAADYLISCYCKSYGMPTAILRPFNIYGPGNYKNVIFKFIQAALKNDILKVEGGNQIKDFLFVEDAARAFLAAGEDNVSGEAFNIGSGNAITIKELANKIILLAHSKSMVAENNPRDMKSKNYICDYSKIEKMFSWRPQVGLEEGLKRTINWVKLNLVDN
jgi:nucleoside-diphosphate-sugar epimerase